MDWSVHRQRGVLSAVDTGKFKTGSYITNAVCSLLFFARLFVSSLQSLYNAPHFRNQDIYRCRIGGRVVWKIYASVWWGSSLIECLKHRRNLANNSGGEQNRPQVLGFFHSASCKTQILNFFPTFTPSKWSFRKNISIFICPSSTQ